MAEVAIPKFKQGKKEEYAKHLKTLCTGEISNAQITASFWN